MRILLVNTSRELRPHPVIPIGMACVAQALERAGLEVAICDLSFARKPERALAQALQAARPGLVGLSIRNLDNSSYADPHSYLAELRRIAGVCRQASDAPLVIGGPAVGVAPDALLAELRADWAVAGEGEASAVALARSLEQRQASARRPGLLNAVEPAWAPPAGDLAPALLGDLARYVDVRPYLRRGAALPVQTRRGCPFRCVYCTYPAIEGTTYRTLEPEAVAEEMEQLRQTTGCASFEFVDSTFNIPLPYAQRLCDLLARGPRQLNLQATGLSPAQSSRELLQSMRRAGFQTVVCSPDSAAEPALEGLGKGFGRQDLERLVGWVHQAGIVTLWSFLFGGPGETEATVRETLSFIARRLTSHDLVLIAAGLRIYPGTPLERLARAEGVVAAEDSLLSPASTSRPTSPCGGLGSSSTPTCRPRAIACLSRTCSAARSPGSSAALPRWACHPRCGATPLTCAGSPIACASCRGEGAPGRVGPATCRQRAFARSRPLHVMGVSASAWLHVNRGAGRPASAGRSTRRRGAEHLQCPA